MTARQFIQILILTADGMDSSCAESEPNERKQAALEWHTSSKVLNYSKYQILKPTLNPGLGSWSFLGECQQISPLILNKRYILLTQQTSSDFLSRGFVSEHCQDSTGRITSYPFSTNTDIWFILRDSWTKRHLFFGNSSHCDEISQTISTRMLWPTLPSSAVGNLAIMHRAHLDATTVMEL